jgi:hypothetical protein
MTLNNFNDFSVIHSRDSVSKFENARVVSYYDERPVRALGEVSQ